jgi:hypothetical protein
MNKIGCNLSFIKMKNLKKEKSYSLKSLATMLKIVARFEIRMQQQVLGLYQQ